MKKIALGLMSGTSGDGLSLALVKFGKNDFTLLRYETIDYPPRLSQGILKASQMRTPELARFHMALGGFFATTARAFIRKSGLVSNQIAVIGSHGQTVYHGPDDDPRTTLQIGEPSILAEETGIPVVADFRMRDLAAGGQGAPLIPFFDQQFFGRKGSCALQNIGGIANVAVTGKFKPVIAFDTGPGNCLIDWAAQKVTRGRLKYDVDGKLASRGQIHHAWIEKMRAHAFFRQRPPKSTGRELFNESFIPAPLKKAKPEDLIATLTYFTAYTIADSYRRFIRARLKEILVSGGGALNPVLMNHLKKLLSPTPVFSVEKRGIPAQAKEPVAFAYFALRALEGKINYWPGGTGASGSRILGKIIPGKIHAAS